MSNKISNETKDRINKELKKIAGREQEQYVEAYLDNIEYPKYSWNEAYPYSSAEMWGEEEPVMITEAEVLGDNYPVVDTTVGRAYDDGTTLSYDAYGRRFTMHIRDDVDVHTFLQEIRLFMLGIGYHPECVDEYIEPE